MHCLNWPWVPTSASTPRAFCVLRHTDSRPAQQALILHCGIFSPTVLPYCSRRTGVHERQNSHDRRCRSGRSFSDIRPRFRRSSRRIRCRRPCGEASHSGLVGFRGVRRRDRTGRVLQLGCSPHGCHPADADLANRRRDDRSSQSAACGDRDKHELRHLDYDGHQYDNTRLIHHNCVGYRDLVTDRDGHNHQDQHHPRCHDRVHAARRRGLARSRRITLALSPAHRLA